MGINQFVELLNRTKGWRRHKLALYAWDGIVIISCLYPEFLILGPSDLSWVFHHGSPWFPGLWVWIGTHTIDLPGPPACRQHFSWWYSGSWELRVLHLIGKCSTPWATLLVIFAFVYFSDRVSDFYLKPIMDLDPSTSVSWVAGITIMCHHTWPYR
jgi:hypothetical protein